jgi:hypothetical protein
MFPFGQLSLAFYMTNYNTSVDSATSAHKDTTTATAVRLFSLLDNVRVVIFIFLVFIFLFSIIYIVHPCICLVKG